MKSDSEVLPWQTAYFLKPFDGKFNDLWVCIYYTNDIVGFGSLTYINSDPKHKQVSLGDFFYIVLRFFPCLFKRLQFLACFCIPSGYPRLTNLINCYFVRRVRNIGKPTTQSTF